MVRADRS